MAKPVVTDSQRRANVVHELIASDPALQRLGVEVVRAEGTDDRLEIGARKGRRHLAAIRGHDWCTLPLEQLKAELKAELIAATEEA